jgi:hypothetical protein
LKSLKTQDLEHTELGKTNGKLKSRAESTPHPSVAMNFYFKDLHADSNGIGVRERKHRGRVRREY